MTRTLTELNTTVKIAAKDDKIDLTDATGLDITNTMYRAVVTLFPWSEFRETSTIASVVSGTGTYAWPLPATVIYTDVVAIEVGIDFSDSEFVLLEKPPSELEWNRASAESDSRPVYYMRYSVSGTDYIEIRPAPNYGTATLQVTGTIEPTALTTGTDVTEFLARSADDALAYLIAAEYLTRDGRQQDANTQVQKAVTQFKNLFKDEEITVETVKTITGVE